MKNSSVNVRVEGDAGSIPGLRRHPGEGNNSPFQYSCLENPMDRGVLWATIQGVTIESEVTLKLNTHAHTHAYVIKYESMYAHIFSVQSNSLQPPGQQQARLPCPSLSPGVWSDVYIIMVIIMGHFLHKCLSNFLSTICWRLSTAHWNTFHLCLKSTDHIHVDVFLDCLSQGLVNYDPWANYGLILVFARKAD